MPKCVPRAISRPLLAVALAVGLLAPIATAIELVSPPAASATPFDPNCQVSVSVGTVGLDNGVYATVTYNNCSFPVRAWQKCQFLFLTETNTGNQVILGQSNTSCSFGYTQVHWGYQKLYNGQWVLYQYG